MTSLLRHGRRLLFALAAATCVVAGTMGAPGAGAGVRTALAAPGRAAPSGAARSRGAARATVGAGRRYATLLFSRSEITAADGCKRDDTGIARLDTTVAPYLQTLGMRGTGSLVTAKTATSASRCTHNGDSLAVSWDKATSLAQRYGWSFVSATATYPLRLSSLTPARQWAETCGSALTLDAHGLPGGHGLIAYPGEQGVPATVQARDGAKCFAWGREYNKSGVTTALMGTTAPFWQYTRVLNGGPCNDPSAWCYTIPATGTVRYVEPGAYIAMIDALKPGQWLTLQAFILVTGKNPAYTRNKTRWNCTSSDPAMHWTNDVERYCYKDFQRIVRAIAERGITVTDPLTVGKAFGRPAIYP